MPVDIPRPIEYAGDPPDGTGEILADLRRQRFYGSLEIMFQAGRVVLLKKSETLKPDERNNRGSNAKTEPR